MKMTETIRVRVSKGMKSHLETLAEKRGPGSKVADLVREAIHQVYFVNLPKKNRGGGVETYPRRTYKI